MLKKNEVSPFLVILLFHLLAVIFSEGFHRPDEHLGIMRYVGFKLDFLTANEAFIGWEYPARIRPWLQPAFYVALLKPFTMFGIKNPFFLTLILRFVSSLIGVLSMVILYRWGRPFFKDEKIKFIVLWSLALLWYLPFFHARTTSENLSISFLIFSLPLLWQENSHSDSLSSLMAGFFLGISFILRYQMSVAIFFICLWRLIFVKKQIWPLFIVVIGFCLANAMGVLIDYWGYGEWVFPPYNYFTFNIIDNKASAFGGDPWYKYIEKIFLRGFPPIGALILISSFWCWLNKPLHPITWITLPFLIVHSYIGHKELRFLFGLGLFAPFLFGLWLESHPKFLHYLKTKNFLIACSLVLMLYSSCKPAHTPLSFYKYLYYSDIPVTNITTSDHIRDPLFFYMKEKFSFLTIMEQDEFLRKSQSVPGLYLSKKPEIIEKLDHSCRPLYKPYPDWVLEYKPKFIKMKYWALYSC